MNAVVQDNQALALSEDFTPTDKQKHRWERAIANAEPRFLELAPTGLDYNAERVFAYQILSRKGNEYAMSVAENNPQSLLLALVNLAATGLTLNPAHAFAYLVPRDGAIKLDISYRGFIKIATDGGAILWAKAELVHERDHFDYRGPAQEPEHHADPFGDRGAIRGAYCIAKTADGAVLCDAMSLDELYRVRACSDAWTKGAKGKKGPWEAWEPEMMKKTVLKRARKTWPQSTQLERLDKAIDVANDTEGGYTLDGPRLIGRPNDGVWEALDADTQVGLQKTAAAIRDFFDQGDVAGAVHRIRSERIDSDADLFAALFTLLDSKTRTAIRKEMRKPA